MDDAPDPFAPGLQDGPVVPPPPPVPKNKYRCGGSRRTPKACEHEAPEPWRGRCPACKQPYDCLRIRGDQIADRMNRTMALATEKKPMPRISTGVPELDQVLGGGVVCGNVVLCGGPKAIGKSTLLLKACDGFAQDGRKALYACGEMSEAQLLEYGARIGAASTGIAVYENQNGYINVDEMLEQLEAVGAKLCIVDSLQKCEFDDIDKEMGNPAQINATITMLTTYAKKHKVAFIIISHMNSEGYYMGGESKLHDVDVLLKFNNYVDDGYAKNRDKKVLEKVRVLSISDRKNRQGDPDCVTVLYDSGKGMVTPPPEVKAILLAIDLAKQAEEDAEDAEDSGILT